MPHYAASLFDKVPVYQYPELKGLVEIMIYSKTCVKRPLKIEKTKILRTNGNLMNVKSIAECSLWGILQYF